MRVAMEVIPRRWPSDKYPFQLADCVWLENESPTHKQTVIIESYKKSEWPRYNGPLPAIVKAVSGSWFVPAFDHEIGSFVSKQVEGIDHLETYIDRKEMIKIMKWKELAQPFSTSLLDPVEMEDGKMNIWLLKCPYYMKEYKSKLVKRAGSTEGILVFGEI
jgi:hypothetical protein